MRIAVFADTGATSRAAAEAVAKAARRAVGSRGKFSAALSGGSTPGPMLRAFAETRAPWERMQLFQVDERAAPAGHPDRNWMSLRRCLAPAPLSEAQLHAMPVEDADLSGAAIRYASTLEQVVGRPAVLDLVHLGLGADGHTASLVPGDPVLEVSDRDVAPTAVPYQGRLRMTLTYPVLARARKILWLVTGRDKRAMLTRLRAGDPSIPAGRVARARAVVFCDQEAAGTDRPGPLPAE